MKTAGFARRGALATVIVAVAIVAVLAYVVIGRRSLPSVPVHALSKDVSISGPLKQSDVEALKRAGFRTIMDLVPEAETAGIPAYVEMQKLISEAGLGFVYLPVKEGPIPRPSVEALASNLKRMPMPAVLYGRTEQRSARIWALAEASKPGGLDAAAIEQAAKSAGQSVDDLASQIDARIAARPK